MPPEADVTGASETQAPDVGAAPPPPQTTTPGRTLSQEEVDRIVSQRVAETERAARRKLLEEAGVPTLEELRSTLKSAKEQKDANRSELDKALAEARAEIEAARIEREQLADKDHGLTLRQALADAGAPSKLIPDLAKLVDVERGADEAAVAAAVEITKEKFAPLFGHPMANPNPSEPSGGAAPPRTSHSPDALSRGAERAKSYNEGTHIPNYP